MKIRLISDLHCDINNDILNQYKFGFIPELGQEDVLIIAGDISNSIKESTYHLEELNSKIKHDNLKTKVLFIKGNHELYSSKVEKQTIDTANMLLSQRFSGGNICFLNNSCYIKDDYIFIGTTLYSDFSLYCRPSVHGLIAEEGMNDFRMVMKGNFNTGTEYPITYKDYISEFNKSIKYIDEVSNLNPDKKIVVVTHFAPSKGSISPKYGFNELNPAYATDLSSFMLSHPNIKLWCHGHMHDPFNYKIGECEICCEPYGYYYYDHFNTPDKYKGKIIELT